MKQINLLSWREHRKKLKISQFFIVWFGTLCTCFILLFITKILIIKQIKHYQLVSNHILLQIKTLSPTVQKTKKLKLASKELKKIIKIVQTNHQKIKKILDFITHLKYLITPDIFLRLIEFNPPYLNLVMHASSEKKYLTFIKFLQFKYDQKLQWVMFNKSQDLQCDFLIQMLI
ncbi:MAG: hypothetical protein WA659_06525 [Candidatus Aquirickettsiella sp.]